MHDILENFGETALFVFFLMGVVVTIIIMKTTSGSGTHFGCDASDAEAGMDPARFCKDNYIVHKETPNNRFMCLTIRPGETTDVHMLHESVFFPSRNGVLEILLMNHAPCNHATQESRPFDVPKGIYRFRNPHKTMTIVIFVCESKRCYPVESSSSNAHGVRFSDTSTSCTQPLGGSSSLLPGE